MMSYRQRAQAEQDQFRRYLLEQLAANEQAIRALARVLQLQQRAGLMTPDRRERSKFARVELARERSVLRSVLAAYEVSRA